MKFVVFHGAYGSPEGNWFLALKEGLENLGQTVIVPEFPVERWDSVIEKGKSFKGKNQTLNNWTKAFQSVKRHLKKGEKLCFVGHSLGALFILHLIEKYHIKLDSAIFVSPFLSELDDWRFDNVNKTFYKTDFNWAELKKLIPLSYVLYSDSDPYVDQKYPVEFAKNLGSSLIFVTKGGHLNAEVNLNEFPLVFELCKTRIDLSLYQKFLAHRRELFAVPYVNDKTEEVIYLDPREVFAEGIFHFRNMKRDGFATFYTALKFWDTESTYMEEARKAAKRIGNFSRVFILASLKDLKKAKLREQIRLDLDAGIKVYLCNESEVENKIGELDFGIWDNDYVCTVGFNKKNKVNEVKVSSRKKDLKVASSWRQKVLNTATRVYKLKDIDRYVASQ